MNENVIENEMSITEPTAGEMLRNARTTGRRKREISTVAKQLCIREEFLTALEEGNYADIPETVYILGFARNYAMELGLDPDEIVTKIKCEMGLISDCLATDATADCIVDKMSDKSFDFAMVKAWVGKSMKYVRAKWKWFLGGVAALILIVVLSIVLFGGNESTMSDAELNADAPVVTTNVTEPKYAVNVRERFGVDNREKASIIIQAIAESWVKIEDGRGNTVFSRVLVPGDVYYMPVGNKFKGTFGNAGGIDVWVDGKLAPKLGGNQVRKSDILMTTESLMSK